MLLVVANIVLAETQSETSEFVPDELIVKLKDSAKINSLELENVKALKKITRSNNKYFSDKGIDRLFVLKVDDAREAIEKLRNHPAVEYVELNYYVSTMVIPNDTEFDKLYGLHNTGQTGGIADADIDAPEAWDIETGDNAIVVAVIDTGIDYEHKDLVNNMWTNINEVPNNSLDDDNNGFIDDYLGWDFYNDDNNPFDDNGHGTHVAGTIGAVGNNSEGVVGVVWNVRIMPIKFLNRFGSGSTADAIAAIEYATLMNVDVMSNSWGGSGYSQAMRDAIEAANNAGILFVAAAGNYGWNNDIYPIYPASYNNENIVSVAATDDKDSLASFSNYGVASVDLGAPGVYIYSTVPNGTCNSCSSSGYRYLSGTSMATPHVSGAAALIMSHFPNITHLQVKSRLLGGVDNINALEGKTVSEGRLNVLNSLENDSVAPGKINDLSVIEKRLNSIKLSWTATGDDGNIGTATLYDLRYSTSLIDETNFDSATKVANLPTPKASGSNEEFLVTELEHSTTYHFALKAIDNGGNKGEISNTASDSTLNGTIIFFDDFESAQNGWDAKSFNYTINGTNTSNTTLSNITLWHLETSKYYSPITSWTYNTGSPNYNYNTRSRNSGSLTSPAIDLTGRNYVLLEFYGYYNTEQGTFYDRRFVQISLNNGPFINLIQLSKEPMGAWNKYLLDISTYVGNIVQIRYYFDTIDSLYNDHWGWSIDNVKILVDGNTTPNETINEPPIANAGTDQILSDSDGNGYEIVTLNGSLSYDSDGDIVSYKWYENSILIGNDIIINANFSVGLHNVTLIVTDNGSLSAQDEVIITVNPQPRKLVVFFDDFQNGTFNKWVEGNEFDWRVRKPAERQVPGKNSSNLVAHASKCTSLNGCRLSLINPFDLRNFSSATLKFWRYVDNELDNGEFLKVMAFNSTSWNQIFYWTNLQGDNDIWQNISFNLSGYLSNNFNLAFISKENLIGEDTQVDDVLIEAVQG